LLLLALLLLLLMLQSLTADDCESDRDIFGAVIGCDIVIMSLCVILVVVVGGLGIKPMGIIV
jgi:hypothetical protein